MAEETIARLVAAGNDFGFRLFAQLAERDAGKNVFVSPFSIAVALAMTYNGAAGTTEQAMAETLRLTGLSLAEINAANAALLSRQDHLDPQVRLAIANSIWVHDGITLAPDFTRRVREAYAAEVANLDFDDPGAADIINHWVAGSTQDKITRLVKPSDIDAAIVVLVNAIYFKGLWARQFDEADTRVGPFTLSDGAQKQHPMMAQSGCYNYYETDDFQAVSLPYGVGRISMVIFLPKPASSIVEFRRSLNAESWQRWMNGFCEMEGEIVLPRFRVEYGAELISVLTALGMGIAFSPAADFGGMGVGPLMISKVIHKAFVEVNEQGSEAAAATAVVTLKGFAMIEYFRMVVDRPFFCAIRDNETGAVLFMGLILDPQ